MIKRSGDDDYKLRSDKGDDDGLDSVVTNSGPNVVIGEVDQRE